MGSGLRLCDWSTQPAPHGPGFGMAEPSVKMKVASAGNLAINARNFSLFSLILLVGKKFGISFPSVLI